MNANYQKGVRWERERKLHYESLGRTCNRASGSHGLFDLVVIDDQREYVDLIQAKVVSDLATAQRLLRNFKANPPLQLMKNIHQVLEVKISGSKEVHSATV